jgi:hypothetical protein
LAVGIAGVAAEDLLDCDEAKIVTALCDPNYAKGIVASRTRTKGHCRHGDGTRILLACISGGPVCRPTGAKICAIIVK